jgi:hypothetical protein
MALFARNHACAPHELEYRNCMHKSRLFIEERRTDLWIVKRRSFVGF